MVRVREGRLTLAKEIAANPQQYQNCKSVVKNCAYSPEHNELKQSEASVRKGEAPKCLAPEVVDSVRDLLDPGPILQI